MRLRVLSLVVLLVVAAIAVAGCLVTRHVVHDQERKLLKQRTDEAALYLTSVVAGVQTQLASTASTTALTHESLSAFRASTLLMTKVPGGFQTVALIKTQPSPAVVASSGRPMTGLDPAIAEAIATVGSKTALTGEMVTTPLFDGSAGVRRLGFVYADPVLPGYVVYGENAVNPGAQTPTTSGQPFSELVAAIYAVPRVQGDQLIAASTRQVPLRGHTATAPAAVGKGAPWLLVTKARRPLVGTVATATPWALLGAGLLAALLAMAVVETLSRRREYALAVAEDRTEELKASMGELAVAHEQLVRQERLAAIGELASTIGHELRNPLGVISNAVFLLRGDLGSAPTDAAQRHLTTAEREISAATVIVADLLEFARQREPVITDVDLVALVEEVASVLPPPTGVEMRRDLPAGSLVIRADRDMLRQVLLNLLGNAYQSMADGGEVSVRVRADDGAVTISVADQGVGMDDGVRERLFEPFFTTKARGIGLGLAVSKRLVDAHRGEISVTSRPGEGSTFEVTLPRISAPRRAPDEAPVEETSR